MLGRLGCDGLESEPTREESRPLGPVLTWPSCALCTRAGHLGLELPCLGLKPTCQPPTRWERAMPELGWALCSLLSGSK